MSRLKFAFLAAILALAGASSHRRKLPETRPDKADGHCQLVADSFAAAELGPVSMVPSEPKHDPNLEVCFKGSDDRMRKSCCTKGMEHKFVHNAETDFYVVIKSTSSALKDTLAANSAYYQDQFLYMITSAENQTDVLLGEVYKIPLTDRHSLLQNLFTDLQVYIKQSRVNIRESIDRFFDELFPLVFHNLLNDPTVTNLDEDYRDCLTEIRQQLNPRPFGDVPHRLVHTLSQSMLSARIFLQALNIGVDAINTTDHIMLEPQCIRSMARLRYCGQCDGHIGSRPCRSFCYNVMRGCLATTAEIDRHWNEFVDSVKLLSSYMQGSYNIEEVLRGLHTRISEAIMHSMETGHKFYAKLVQKCGHPKASKRAGGTSGLKPVDTSKAPVEDQEATSALMGERLDNFMRSLMASKGFYHNLADTLCSHEKFATGLADQDHCWNGETLGRYNKSLVPVDLVVQMSSNPEMNVTARRSNSIVTLIDKLIHVKKLLNSKISKEMMQADSRKSSKHRGRNQGYGYSGDDGYAQRDDEDFNSGSGGYVNSNVDWYAGSGRGPLYNHHEHPTKPRDTKPNPDTDIYIDEPSQEPPTFKVTRQPSGSAGYGSGTSCTIASTSLVLVTSLLTFTGLSLWFNG